MRIVDTARTLSLLLVAAAVACTPQGEAEQTREPAVAARAAAAATAVRTLPADAIDSPKEEYAVLRRPSRNRAPRRARRRSPAA